MHEFRERHSRGGGNPALRDLDTHLRGCDIAELRHRSCLFCVTPALAEQARVFVAAFWLDCVSPSGERIVALLILGAESGSRTVYNSFAVPSSALAPTG